MQWDSLFAGFSEADRVAVQRMISFALEEDIGAGDATSDALLDAGLPAKLAFVAREPMVVCGVPVAIMALAERCDDLRFRVVRAEGEVAEAGEEILRVEGPARALLCGERTALNFMQRMSGVASLTRRYVEAVAGTGVVILDTRKTIPGWRALDKYATRTGGAQNHRMRLDDMVMVKDNHVAVVGGIAEAVTRARRAGLPVVLECDTLAQVSEALEAGPDRILLDNMPPARLREAVALVAGRIPLEASGGVSLETIRGIAETGVQYVSVGRITHSAVAVDIGLDVRLPNS